MKSAVLLVLVALTSGAAAQTTGEGTPIVPIATEADYARVVKQAVDGYIVPAFATLQFATGELVPALAGFCASPSDAQRDGVRTAFAATVLAWSGVDFLRFGPMLEKSRIDRFSYFPDVHGTGARQLRRFLASKDAALLEPGALAGQSAAVQGLPALESLLYSGDDALLHAAAPEPFRCDLAARVADNMNVIAGDVLAGWTGDGSWASLIEHPGPDNPVYLTHAEAMTEIVKAILTGLESARDHRLLAALGATPAESKASRAPFNLSGEAIPAMQATGGALERFTETSGILTLLPPAQASYGNSIGFEFGNLDRAFAKAGPELATALAEPPRRSALAYAAIVLQSLRDLFQKQVAVWAGLTPGFNAMDGD